jgi:hypothetical protein
MLIPLIATWRAGINSQAYQFRVLAVLAVTVFLLVYFWPKIQKTSVLIRGIAVVVISSGIAFFVISNRTELISRTSLTDRISQQNMGLRMFSDHPVFGVGIDQFWRFIPQYLQPADIQRNGSLVVPDKTHNLIIDHLAMSIVRDKLSFDRFQFDEYFMTVDSWTKTAGVAHNSIGNVALTTTATTNNKQEFYTTYSDYIYYQANHHQNPHFQTRVYINQITNQEIYIATGYPDDSQAVGFKIVDETLYAFYFTDDDVEHTIEIESVDISGINTYRVEFSNSHTIKWYFNGALVEEQTITDLNIMQIFMTYSIKTTANESKEMAVIDLHYDADYYTP